ncbi:MAG: hypothetical protein ACK53U_01170, partial [Alphaproteobacteria bacterium]
MVAAARRAASDTSNTEWQRDLSVSHARIGHLLQAQGDLGGALAAYRRGIEITEELAASDPSNTQWQRDLGACLIMAVGFFFTLTPARFLVRVPLCLSCCLVELEDVVGGA